MSNLTLAQRMADRVTGFCGSWSFIVYCSIITSIWVLGNTVLLAFTPFDPYPFVFFNLILTVVSTYQSPLIMMSQNRQREIDQEAIQGLHDKLDSLKTMLETNE